MKLLKRVLLLLVLVLGVVIYLNYPKLNIISGYAAKNVASGVYVAHRSAASMNQYDNSAPLVELAVTEVDESNESASSTVYGLMKRTAVYRDGLGAVLVNDDYNPDKMTLRPKRIQPLDTIPYPFGQAAPIDTILPEVDMGQINKALALAFSEPEIQKTRTLLILYKGHLIAEKYINGFDKDTPILGWSMTKSVMATLYGILERQGKLEMDWPAPIAEWKDDERKDITLNHLLRMQSGLAWEEDYTGISDVTRMLFLDSDMTLAQRNKKAIAKPTEIWNYSSGTSNLLSGILRQQFRSHQEYLDFPYSSLLDKIGMYSMVLEADIAGNYVGSSYSWATTRDWARFGQLYLDKGMWNGEQLFNPEWVDYITTPTLHSNGTYGAHFWLNAEWIYPDVPKDLFSCNGFEGQYVFVIPSKDLVVVRTGLAEDPYFNINEVLSTIVNAVP
ncbi:serine hydrolase domain-containing protein [Flagellimonas zhangzhouensis]|uniref:CubicO group peptidase, beta-lactamase class C family n=1 Tax=Flagellimonas zhangzhouensis TaxID=1073328 RepID=A0A1H2SK16_9FLAO|nr:serine hydrolase [Allomuricauda zhangzhouensis]SDQ75824.1 CubicO group peptidase, beta-lactamase class C family [Allomuricauda zhangzhouensis]SDW31971.1 CubicO group peptidase, beta-lactamase class C family [Allomuricauda zhangzhouensis]